MQGVATTPGPPAGLTGEEAARRRAQVGSNEMPDARPSRLLMAIEKFWAPVPWMLEAAIALEIALGKPIEAATIALLLLFNAVLGLLQEGRAQATLSALRARLALTSSVRRDGAWQVLAASELVPGDVIKLTLGGVVPADATLLSGDVLLDQSMLTGESVPVEAASGAPAYAGALVRRGEAVAEVNATGARTRFGRTAELVRGAHVTSSQQKSVLRVVRNLAGFNALVILALAVYAHVLRLPIEEMTPLVLTALLGAIPVALPASFTLAAAIGARALARQGVLPTRLSAVDEAASMDVLCADKTGTLTRNELTVTGLWAPAGGDAGAALVLAALASSDGGQDPVDMAIRRAAAERGTGAAPRLLEFTAFDPARKMAEARAVTADGVAIRIAKGAPAAIGRLAALPAEAEAAITKFAAQGYRVLAVASGARELALVGLIALSDPPRADSAPLIARLAVLGVRTVMVTGDGAETARSVADAIGLDGPACPPGAIPDHVHPRDFAVFAGVLPEDKFTLVSAFQHAGHVVGMCGDGANDAPALRQAQIGIAVSTATDVAKSAAGMVLTEPGLGGIVAAIEEGRLTFQRIQSYTLNSITKKIVALFLLLAGLVVTGHALLTPLSMVIILISGDFLSMALTTDNVRGAALPNVWRVGALTAAGVAIGLAQLGFCIALVLAGRFRLGLDPERLRSLAFVSLVFGSQAVVYSIRARRHVLGTRPSLWLLLSTLADSSIAAGLAVSGVAMAALPGLVVAGAAGAAVLFALVLAVAKLPLFRLLRLE